ncbi:hypothetical protein NVP1121O_202 [Vibrio phage 1.121.O._10N.286.46.C4]|nr:hypothetical protein NVP1121O_202 [Vibrio phage 1.121.O._10N.286.46.C4]
MIEFKKEWEEVYFSGKQDAEGRDLHQEFADLCGITRQEAKELCYKNMYQPDTPWLLHSTLEVHRETYKEHKKSESFV